MATKKVIKKGLPPWMATFADLCTLLLTFFVLLLTFASMDIQKFKDMLGSVQMAFGVQFEETGNYQAVKPEEDGAQKIQKAPQNTMRRLSTQPRQPDLEAAMEDKRAAEAAEMAKQIRKMIDQEGVADSAEVTSGTQGVRLRIKGTLLFDPGEATLKSKSKALLKGVAAVMSKRNFYLTIEGHTDALPISTAQYASNWELSSARATAVLRELADKNVNQSRMSAVGYAANYPLASNDTPDGREKNRRVEFVFTKKPLRVGVN